VSNACTVRIDDGVKRDILARIDIGDYIGSVVSLRKRGNDLVGLCPFHGEKSPSFHVHPDRGFFKCFGCSAGGDVIRFVQLHDNLNFVDAMRVLAKRAGIELEAEDPATSRLRSEKEAIYHANDIAARWFHQMLLHDASGARARAYCERREISAASIAEFMLGYAPDRWDGLTGELERAGVPPDLAAKAGLVKPGQRGYYDFYRDRLIIPTRAVTGETIAFGGRLIGEGEPKYLNTTTTPVYTKGRFLFALGAARRAAQREGAIVVVEGYLDCIALHQAGLTNAVASLGTAFTPDQARELRKATENVFVCFDGDVAGLAATAKSVDMLVAEGLSARIVRLPSGEDPDSYVRAHGAAGFRARLAEAAPWVQFKIDRELEALKSGFTSAAEIARRAEALVHGLPREEWDRWRVYVAGRLGINVDDLRKSRLLVNSALFGPRGATAAPSRHITPGAMEIPTFERDVLAVVLDEPPLVAEYRDRIPPERFDDPVLRRIYGTLCDRASALVQPADVFALFSDDGDVSATLASIAGSERSRIVRFADGNARRAFLDRLIERFSADDRQSRFRELDAQMDALLEAGQPVPQELRAEHTALHAAKVKG
jgi:DNA primase catalytic core